MVKITGEYTRLIVVKGLIGITAWLDLQGVVSGPSSPRMVIEKVIDPRKRACIEGSGSWESIVLAKIGISLFVPRSWPLAWTASARVMTHREEGDTRSLWRGETGQARNRSESVASASRHPATTGTIAGFPDEMAGHPATKENIYSLWQCLHKMNSNRG